MIVLDTTVLVYAKGADHPLRDPCRRLIEVIAARRVEATTTPEAIQEFMHVRARRRSRADAARAGPRLRGAALAPAPGGPPPASPRPGAVRSGHDLGAFDSVLAAAALSADATHLVSAHRAFSEVEGLDTVEPDAAGIAALVG